MIYAGFDMSLTSPLVCTWDSNTDLIFKNLKFFSFGNYSHIKKIEGSHGNVVILKQPSYTCAEERYKNIVQWAQSVVSVCGVDKAAFEGYAFGSAANSSSICDLAELNGSLKRMLYDLKIPFHIAEPSAVKKSATGKGNAKKDQMYQAFREQFGICLEGILGYDVLDDNNVIKKVENNPWDLKPIDDIADAFYIMLEHPDLKERNLCPPKVATKKQK